MAASLSGRIYQLQRQARRWLPGECLICMAPVRLPEDICNACRVSLPANQRACQHCAEPLSDYAGTSPQGWCATCTLTPPAFDQVYAPWRYQPPLDRLLLRFKYHQDLCAGSLWLDLLQPALQQMQSPIDAFLCIPSQQARIRQYGLSAPFWLAQRLAWINGLPFQPDWLQRRTSCPPQQTLNRKQRWRNPARTFQASGQVAGRHLLLIDDVMTTGATLHWAAHTLKQKGAARVDVLVAARAVCP